MRLFIRVKMLGFPPDPQVHPAKANNKLAEINVVRFIFKVSPLNSVVNTCKGALFPEQLYDAIPVVQAKMENFS